MLLRQTKKRESKGKEALHSLVHNQLHDAAYIKEVTRIKVTAKGNDM